MAFIIYNKIKDFNNQRFGRILSDIESHMPDGHIYKNSDLVTYAHETCHGIHSNIRQKYGGKVNATYVVDNWASVLQEANTTLANIASLTRYKGNVYNLYLIQQQQYWNNEPLYVLDEWICYTNGAMVGLELNLNRSESLTYAVEFCFYVEALLKSVKNTDLSYSQLKQLQQFCSWHVRRVMFLVKKARGTNMYNDLQDLLLSRFLNKRATCNDIKCNYEEIIGCSLCK